MQKDQPRKFKETEFFTEYGEANRYKILEVIGKGSYGVVCAAIDTHTGQKVAIKKIHNVFEHTSDAIRILREVKLLRLLRHPDIVEIKCITVPHSKREFKDIYVVFELMESDLHQVIKVNDDLTKEHHQFFLYQMLRALKYMHTANVYHRDLKPKNILANANCKLKVCDFGLARVAFNDIPTAIFWTDYVATRWYRAPELCGSFSSKYTTAIDIWSIGCIFAEVLRGKPLFPGKSVVHQLDLITDLLGTPSLETISGVRNEKARKYLGGMRKKQPVPFAQKFPDADPLVLKLLRRLLAFDPKDRPTAEEALADPYFKGLAKVEREPSCRAISKLEFEFEMRRVAKEDIRELLYREILEYHPQLLQDYMSGTEGTNFVYPSGIGHIRKQFAHLQEDHHQGGKSGPVIPLERKHVSLPRSTVHSSSTIHIPNPEPNLGRSQQQATTSDVSLKNSSRATTDALEFNGHSGIVAVGVSPHVPGSAKPGRVVVGAYENDRRSMKDKYDLMKTTTATVLHYRSCIDLPQTDYCFLQPHHENFNTNVGNSLQVQEKKEKLSSVQQRRRRPSPFGDIIINPNPYSHSQASVGNHLTERIAIDAKVVLSQTQSQLGTVVAHMNVGSV